MPSGPGLFKGDAILLDECQEQAEPIFKETMRLKKMGVKIRDNPTQSSLLQRPDVNSRTTTYGWN